MFRGNQTNKKSYAKFGTCLHKNKHLNFIFIFQVLFYSSCISVYLVLHSEYL
mgnify:CR=1 FL=1